MKKILCLLLASSLFIIATSQNVGIGTTTPHSSARLDVSATDKGILVPRISLTNIITAAPVTSPAAGLLVWNINAAVAGGNGIGFYYWDGAVWQKLIQGNEAWKLNGNSGTDTLIHFIGTTDNRPLNFRINSIPAGKIDANFNNVFLGEKAGMNTIPTNPFNARSNVFIGDSAGFGNTGGALNTFVGARAGEQNSTGFANSFFGLSSGAENTTGTSNSFFGIGSGASNATGSGNSFFGSNAGLNVVGENDNSFFGSSAGDNLVSGNRNSFFGANTGGSFNSGSRNTLIGDSAGYSFQSGSSDNTLVGYRTTNLGNSINSTAIGSRARINCSNCMILGSVNGINGATSSINVGIGLISPQRPLHVSGSSTATGITPHSDAVIVAERNGDAAYINILTNENQSSGILFGNQGSTADAGIFFNTGGNTDDLRFRTNNNNTRMTIDSTGQVGIGTTTPDFQLELSLNSAAKPTSSAWTVPSDARLKENISVFSDGLSVLNKINTVSYSYTGAAGLPRETGIGTIAQELQQIAPYMIKTWTRNEANGRSTQYLGVDYGPLQFILINSIKEQQQIIDQQKTELDQYKLIVNDLLKRVELLEKNK